MAKSVVYNQQRTACSGPPPIFRSKDDALLWAVRQGAFADREEAQRAFAELQGLVIAGLWAYWLGLVGKRVEAQQRANPAPKQGRLLRG